MGPFTVTLDITPYAKAKLFSQIGKQTETFLRFSTVGGEKGSADTERTPQTNLKSAEMMWDFWCRPPESLHQFTILFSDRGTPDGYRHMDGVGSHAFSLIHARSERV